MKVTRRLELRRERLAELTSDELREIGAGVQPEQPSEKCPSYSNYCITGEQLCNLSRRIC